MEGYVAVTRRFARALRAVNPELQIAVAAAPFQHSTWHRGGWIEKYKHWNDVLAREAYYDALVYHEYPGPWRDVMRAGTITEYLAGEASVDRTVKAFQAAFPNKPMWMTEWNMGGMQNLGHTGLHVLFLASRFLRTLDHAPTIRIACTHQLFEQRFGPFALDGNGRPVKYAEFAFWRLVGRVMSECDQMLPTNITPRDQTGWEFPVSAPKAFRGAGPIHVLVVNKLPEAKKLELQIDGRPWTGSGQATWFSVTRLSDRPTAPLRESLLKTTRFDGLPIIPPYSVSHLLFRTD